MKNTWESIWIRLPLSSIWRTTTGLKGRLLVSSERWHPIWGFCRLEGLSLLTIAYLQRYLSIWRNWSGLTLWTVKVCSRRLLNWWFSRTLSYKRSSYLAASTQSTTELCSSFRACTRHLHSWTYHMSRRWLMKASSISKHTSTSYHLWSLTTFLASPQLASPS